MKKLIAIFLLSGATLLAHAQLTPQQMGGMFYAYHEPADVVALTPPDGYNLVYLRDRKSVV